MCIYGAGSAYKCGSAVANETEPSGRSGDPEYAAFVFLTVHGEFSTFVLYRLYSPVFEDKGGEHAPEKFVAEETAIEGDCGRGEQEARDRNQ
jgi:hypothetical protein